MARQALTTVQRGYGATHRAQRKAWATIVEAGHATCYRCGQWIQPGTPWDLGHTPDRLAHVGPEHRRCNRADGGRRGNQQRWGTRRRVAITANRW